MHHVQFVPSTSSSATLLPRPEEEKKSNLWIVLRIMKLYWEGDFSDQQLAQQTR